MQFFYALGLPLPAKDLSPVQYGTTTATLRSKMGAYMRHVLDSQSLPVDAREKRMELARITREHFRIHPASFTKSAKSFKKEAPKLRKKLGLI